MENIIYIVTGRYGCDLADPVVFKTELDAENYVASIITNRIRDDYMEKLEEENIDTLSDIDVMNWGIEMGLCDEFTYMADSDWSEYMITKYEL